MTQSYNVNQSYTIKGISDFSIDMPLILLLNIGDAKSD